ncbi:HlyC/CorC family transporter [bacterium]|nr:HlyC/CorC family transporter [bacterium]
MDQISQLSQIALFFFLILCSALCSGTETALFSLRHHRLKRFANDHPRATKVLYKILKQPREFISTILVCNNFANVAASALATRICIEIWGDSGIIIATVAVTAILLIGAEITPKTYAASHSESISLKAALPLNLFITILMPVNRFLALAVNLLLHLMGMPKKVQPPGISDEELKSIIITGQQEGLLRKSESSMLANILDIDKTRARGVMKPRAQIISLALDTPLKKINEVIRKNGFSRYPVYDRETENIIGILHIKDLFRRTGKQFSLKPLLRPVHFFPETATLDDLLEIFRRHRICLGIVVDEYGGVEGLLSRDDIVSEIVGHLADETDRNTPSPITSLGDNSYLVPGTISLRRIEQEIPVIKFSSDLTYDNLASLILDHLGEIPEPGALVKLDNMELKVSKTSLNRIIQVKISHFLPPSK